MSNVTKSNPVFILKTILELLYPVLLTILFALFLDEANKQDTSVYQLTFSIFLFLPLLLEWATRKTLSKEKIRGLEKYVWVIATIIVFALSIYFIDYLQDYNVQYRF